MENPLCRGNRTLAGRSKDKIQTEKKEQEPNFHPKAEMEIVFFLQLSGTTDWAEWNCLWTRGDDDDTIWRKCRGGWGNFPHGALVMTERTFIKLAQNLKKRYFGYSSHQLT
jgi:hypothetical protein